MARVNIEPDNKNIDKDLLRREVRQEVKKEFFRADLKTKIRKLFRRLGCCIFVLIILAGLVVWLGVLAERRGWTDWPMVGQYLDVKDWPIVNRFFGN